MARATTVGTTLARAWTARSNVLLLLCAMYFLTYMSRACADISEAELQGILENARLKKLLAESLLENDILKEALRKKW